MDKTKLQERKVMKMWISKKKLAELERRVEKTEAEVGRITSLFVNHMGEHEKSIEELKEIVALIDRHARGTEQTL